MNEMEQWSFGRIVAYFRSRSDKTAGEVVPLFGYSSPSWLSDIETDKAVRPTLERVKQFARVYRMYPSEYSYLLRASDYPATSEEVEDLRVRLSNLLEGFPDPAYVLDYRYQLVCWNRLFADLYDSASPSSRVPRQDATLPPGSLHSVISASSGSSSQSDTTTPLSGTIGGAAAPLQVGLPFLQLIFSWDSRLRSELELEEWERLAHYFLVRFWRTTLPLIQPRWYEPEGKGEPAWLRDFLAAMSAPTTLAGADFVRHSEAVRTRLEEDPGDASVQLFTDFMNDTVSFWHGRTKFLLHTTELRDGRFILFRHGPVGGTHIAL
jgi:Helix-turn-helix domain